MVVEQDNPDFRRETRNAAWRAIAFAGVQFYFWLWSWKKDKAKYLKYTALGILSSSTVFLAVEVASEMAGSRGLVSLVGYLFQQAERYRVSATFVFVLFLGAVVYMIIHNYREARRPEYEFNFATRLYEYIESERILGSGDPQQRVKNALQLIYSVFRRAGAKHACLHTLDGDGMLVILEDNVFPAETDQAYFVKLEPGKGVAGRVYLDQRVRYMPRVKLLWRVFPHAVNFAYHRVEETQTGEFRYEFVERRPDYFLFQPNAKPSLPFKAFLSVPVGSADGRHCAVLSIDFDRKDPIDKGDIVMAAVFGRILTT